MKVKLILLSLCFILSFNCRATILYYSYSNERTAVVIGCYLGTTGSVVVPEETMAANNGFKVIGIGEYAFKNCSQVTSIELPRSIQSIEMYAFKNCSKLDTINIPLSVKIMNEGIFSGCVGLKSFSISNKITRIKKWAFQNCTGLKKIQIHSGKTIIETGAFNGCNNLTSIACATKVPPVIGANAFANYNATVYVPEDCEDIYRNDAGWGRFKNIIEDKPYSIVTTVNGIKYGLVKTAKTAWIVGYTKDMKADPVIPKTVNYNNSVYTVTGVYKKAFQGCTSLKSISLPKTVKIIGQYAFYLSGISSIVLPDNIDTVGDCAFTNMESVHVLAKVPPVITVFSFGTLNDKGMFCMDTELPIRVPAGCKQIYGKAEVWKEFTNIVEEQRPVGLNAIDADSAIRYADGMLYLKDAETQAAITIYTAEGKCIRSCKAVAGVCDLSMLPDGVYIVRICIDGKVTDIKILK